MLVRLHGPLWLSRFISAASPRRERRFSAVRLPSMVCVGRQQLPVDESSCSPYAEICFATRASAYSANGVMRREKGEKREKQKRERKISGVEMDFGAARAGQRRSQRRAWPHTATRIIRRLVPRCLFPFFSPRRHPDVLPAHCPGRPPCVRFSGRSRYPRCTAPARPLLFSSIFRFFRAGRTPAAGTRRATSSRL